MLLLLASFSISLAAYFFVQGLRHISESAKKIACVSTTTSYADCYLEAVNLNIQHTLTWVPTFFRVYLIGIVETIYITLCQRGLFKGTTTRALNESHVNALASDNAGHGAQLAVITGGDSGIGFEICKGLLKAGFHMIIGTHSEKSCEGVIDALQKLTDSDKIECIPLDLTSYTSVQQFVIQVQEKAPKKDIQLLINNAGIMNTPCKMTEDGFESQCQTNFLSPILLTQFLLPYMNSKSGRVLFASSSTLYAINNLDLNTPLATYGLNGLEHYAYSKSCIAQLVPRLAKTTTVKICTYHPGTVRTKLFSTTTVFNLPIVSKIFNFIMLSPKEGSATPLYLCLSKDLPSTGTYWANERQYALPSVSIHGKENDIEELWLDTMTKIGLKKKVIK